MRHVGVHAGHRGQRGEQPCGMLSYQQSALPGYMCMYYLKRAMQVSMLGTGGREGGSPVGCFLINKAYCLGICECVTLNAPRRCPCWAQGAEGGAALLIALQQQLWHLLLERGQGLGLLVLVQKEVGMLVVLLPLT